MNTAILELIGMMYPDETKNGKNTKNNRLCRAREAGQQLAASYYGFDGFPEFMFVFFFFGPFSEARLTDSFREVLFGSAFFLGSGPFSALSATSVSSTS